MNYTQTFYVFSEFACVQINTCKSWFVYTCNSHFSHSQKCVSLISYSVVFPTPFELHFIAPYVSLCMSVSCCTHSYIAFLFVLVIAHCVHTHLLSIFICICTFFLLYMYTTIIKMYRHLTNLLVIALHYHLHSG